MTVSFAGFELDSDRFELRRGGSAVPLEPQAFEVLSYLVSNAGRVVSRQELFDAIWGSSFVSDAALATRIKEARRALGDDGRNQRFIRTVHGRGYRFDAAREASAPAEPGASEPSSVGSPAIRGTLPAAIAPLVGRELELGELDRLADQARLLTLTGPGGVGKTRLAIELAARRADRYPGGAWFVDLASTRDPDQLPELVAKALNLGLDPAADPGRVVIAALARRRALLLLDNFEHLLAATPFAAALLRETPVALVTTSRERLRLSGEQVFEVSPLPVEPATEDGATPDAVALFERVAQTIRPGFVVDESNRDEIARICRAVDGLPLAIELAAAQVRLLPLAHLRERLAARLDTLGGGMRDRPARQQTLARAIEWSFDLLTPTERELLLRLAVFVGGVSIEAIDRVVESSEDEDPLDGLASLIDRSLLRQQPDRFGEPRFAMLSLVQQFATERLASSTRDAEVRRRHAEYFAGLASELERGRWGEDAATWVDRLAQERGNLDAALAWAFEAGELSLVARLASGLQGFWFREGHFGDSDRWLPLALEHTEGLDPLSVGRLHMGAALVLFGRHQLLDARARYEQALPLFESLEDPRYAAVCQINLSATYLGDDQRYATAVALCEGAVETARRLELDPVVSYGLNIVGELARAHGDDAVAEPAYREALDLARRTGDQRQEAVAVGNLSFIAVHRGRYEEARELSRSALRICWEVGHRVMVGWTLIELAGPEFHLGDAERAARLIGAADATLEALGVPRAPGDEHEHQPLFAAIEAHLGTERWLVLKNEGAGMPVDDAVGYALDG